MSTMAKSATLLTLLRYISVTAAGPLSARYAYGQGSGNQSMIYSFENVPSSVDLLWTPCYDNFTCARLEVPLDYEDESAGTTTIAFMKLEATKQPAKGDLIVNPGGPANSGAKAAFVGTAPGLVGDEWNIIGMDPRGVNNSGPHINCFPDSYTQQTFIHHSLNSDINLYDEVPRANYWGLTGALGDWCSKTLDSKVRYANTPATARDMLQYAEKLAISKGEDPKKAKVDYYGASYGTLLGATFARLFPDRLGRFIIDAVADAEDYYSGAWTVGVQQAEEALLDFTHSCYRAGTKCPFFANDTSSENILSRIDAIISSLEKSPIPIVEPETTEHPFIITHNDIRGFILGELYSQVTGYPKIATVLALLEARNSTLLPELLSVKQIHKGDVPRESTHTQQYDGALSRIAIACNDNDGRHNISSPELFSEHLAKQKELSPHFWAPWAITVQPSCWKWGLKVPESQKFPAKFETTQTNAPIVMLASRLDPVASSQDKMVKFFPGARILMLDAVGHGVASVASQCTREAVIKFLGTGELPSEGQVCEADSDPWVVSE
ncbi:unnamed protein product [Periconia digitata]|uniref:Uncharacterized protein n=1 Tax=Periconia digitata TaxID=1303443 RepID=A0A9W4UA62_9PLEO|nr:unnamed protein product [Periconia digitata]